MLSEREYMELSLRVTRAVLGWHRIYSYARTDETAGMFYEMSSVAEWVNENYRTGDWIG